ncbi:hypothetical protein GCM10010199_17490 [Dactylosporangium roseum]
MDTMCCNAIVLECASQRFAVERRTAAEVVEPDWAVHVGRPDTDGPMGAADKPAPPSHHTLRRGRTTAVHFPHLDCAGRRRRGCGVADAPMVAAVWFDTTPI